LKKCGNETIEVHPHTGIAFAKTFKKEESGQVLFTNYSKAAKIPEPVVAVEALVSRCTCDQICEAFKVPAYLNIQDLLIQVARARHYVRKVS
jgi:hypothetical protein